MQYPPGLGAFLFRLRGNSRYVTDQVLDNDRCSEHHCGFPSVCTNPNYTLGAEPIASYGHQSHALLPEATHPPGFGVDVGYQRGNRRASRLKRVTSIGYMLWYLELLGKPQSILSVVACHGVT